MNLISTKTHGILDYGISLLWLFSPWLFGFASGGAETWTTEVTAAFVIFYSLKTKYFAGLFAIVPMWMHLIFDRVVGLVLIVSPWLFGFSQQVWLPHVCAGLAYLLLASLTNYHVSGWIIWKRFVRKHPALFSAAAG